MMLPSVGAEARAARLTVSNVTSDRTSRRVSMGEISSRRANGPGSTALLAQPLPAQSSGVDQTRRVLRNEFLANAAFSNNIDRTVAWSQQLLFAGDAELVIDRHGQIFDRKRIVFGL